MSGGKLYESPNVAATCENIRILKSNGRIDLVSCVYILESQWCLFVDLKQGLDYVHKAPLKSNNLKAFCYQILHCSEAIHLCVYSHVPVYCVGISVFVYKVTFLSDHASSTGGYIRIW